MYGLFCIQETFMKKIILGIYLLLTTTLPTYAADILLIRGLDQVIFRGMDKLGEELAAKGHRVTVSSPVASLFDYHSYDVLIGNSQGGHFVMVRSQAKKPRMIVTIDVPYNRQAIKGVKHLNIYGTWPVAGKVIGGTNKHLSLGHLPLSYSPAMRKMVKDFVR